MQFQELLMALYKCHAQGLIYFDSEYLAAFLNRQIKEVSKDLSRLYHMGFLKRRRLKRECLSKRGKLCYKGYKYEYSLSNQGLNYIQWMTQEKPFEEALYFKIVSEVAVQIPEDLKEANILYAIYKGNSRYKGANRLLQTLGVMFPLLPALAGRLAKMASEKEMLEKECENLKKECEGLKGILNEFAKIINELYIKNEQFTQIGCKLFLINVKMIEAYEKLFYALSIKNEAQRKIITDLGLILMMKYPEEAFKLLKFISRYYAREQIFYEEYIGEAKQIIKELKANNHNTGLF